MDKYTENNMEMGMAEMITRGIMVMIAKKEGIEIDEAMRAVDIAVSQNFKNSDMERERGSLIKV